jgi:hypothetical protein
MLNKARARWSRCAATLQVGLLFGLVSGLLAACAREAPPPPVPDVVDRFGALELVTHTRSYRMADSNHNGQGFGRMQDWSLRWQGQPLVLDSLGGMFGDQPQKTGAVNAVYVLGRGAAPELIVHVGDPNNTSAFHALRQQGGRLDTPLLCVSSGADHAVGWVADPAQRQVFDGPQHQVLEGGRWLQLGSHCLVDVQQQRVWRVPQSAEVSALLTVRPLGLSPDGRGLVRFGSVSGLLEPPRQDEPAESVPHLLVADLQAVDRWTPGLGNEVQGIAAGGWQVLRINRQRMRYASPETDLDAAWLAHHFEWKRGADGRDRLVARSSFKPLPWRGVFSSALGGEYKLAAAQQDLRPPLLALLQQRFAAQLLPRPAGEDARYTSVRVRGEKLTLHPLGFFADTASADTRGPPGDPRLQQALVKEVGDAFDAELATGRHDRLFDKP